jgi:hypothetical protein
LLTIPIFVFAGAVVNVAVAWSILWKTDLNPNFPAQQQVGEEWLWPCDAPTHWPDTADRLYRAKGSGVLWLWYLADRPAGADLESFGLYICRAGWPILGLGCVDWQERLLLMATVEEDLRAGRPQVTERTEGHPPQSNWWVRGIPVESSTRSAGAQAWTRLPIRPSWPGFAVNTIFYAAILWLLICGPFVPRRFLRRRRGLCPACAYPMGKSVTCAECGKPLPKRAVA